MPRSLSAVLGLLLTLVSFTARADGIDSGVASVEITPPKGYRMAGYFSERFNTGTRDPLLAKALVFRQGNMQAALVFCDLIDVPQPIANRARAEASRRSGIPVSRIAIAATHSHTGPLFHGVLQTRFAKKAAATTGHDTDEVYDFPGKLVDHIAEVILAAQKNAVPSQLSAGFVGQTNLTFNRRFLLKDGTVRFNPGLLNPDIVHTVGPIDSDAGVLLVRPEQGDTPYAGLTVFALHLDTVGGTAYAADYPFYMQDELRKAFGPGFFSLFGAGTCGDLNHIDVSRREIAKTEVIGRELGRAIAAHVEAIKAVNEPQLDVASEVVEVPLQQFGAGELAEARKVLDNFEANKTPFLEIVRAVKVVDIADNYPGSTDRLEVQAFRLGKDLAIVTLPGEVFVEHGLAIKNASPFKTTFVVELANADCAYVPTTKAFSEGSYEVVNSRMAPGGGETLVKAAVRLLRQLDGPSR